MRHSAAAGGTSEGRLGEALPGVRYSGSHVWGQLVRALSSVALRSAGSAHPRSGRPPRAAQRLRGGRSVGRLGEALPGVSTGDDLGAHGARGSRGPGTSTRMSCARALQLLLACLLQGDSLLHPCCLTSHRISDSAAVPLHSLATTPQHHFADVTAGSPCGIATPKLRLQLMIIPRDMKAMESLKLRLQLRAGPISWPSIHCTGRQQHTCSSSSRSRWATSSASSSCCRRCSFLSCSLHMRAAACQSLAAAQARYSQLVCAHTPYSSLFATRTSLGPPLPICRAPLADQIFFWRLSS